MNKGKKLHIAGLMFILTVSLLPFFGAETHPVKAQLIPAPTTKMETKFIVYPDGWVSTGALINQTVPSYPQYGPPPPTGYATLKFGWDGLLKASVDSVYTLPKENVKDFPLNSTTLSIHARKLGDTVTSQINATVTMPSSVRSAFPFNMTDLSLVSDYQAGKINGNLTIIVAGYPAGPIDFSGNRTHISLTGTAIVPFLSFQGVTIDRTMVVQVLNYLILNFTGRDPGSLWDVTDGVAEISSFSNTTTFNDNYASVSFEMQIQGDFIGSLSKLPFPIFGVPVPESLMAKALNSTLDKVQRDTVQLAYTYSDGKLVYKETTIVTTTDFTEDLQDILTSIPDMPYSLKALIDALLGKIYASIDSAELSATYSLVGEFVKEGRITFALDMTFGGDLNEELNYIRAKVLSYYMATLPTWVPVPWQSTFINETLVDVGRLKLSFNVTTSSVVLGWENLRVLPPKDVINATHFKLKRFFNLTYAPPTYETPVKITVEGGNNVTHTVSLYRPSNVPAPNSATNSKTMVWENQTLSGIQDLTFKIEPVITGPLAAGTITNPALVTEANPFTIDASEEAMTTLIINSISAPATIIVRNQTEAPGVMSAPATFSMLGTYVEVLSSEEVDVNATIRINYTPEQLAAAGIDESTLKIHYWDADLEDWVEVDTQVNAEEHYAWATIDHFNIWGLFGQPVAPFWTQWWFYAIIGVVIVVVAGAFILMRKQKTAVHKTPEVTSETDKPTSNTLYLF